MSKKIIQVVVVSILCSAPVLVLGQDAPQMDMDAMMAAMAKAAEVGPQHKMLAELAGKFNVEMKMWMDPSSEPMAMSGKAERSMMLGGRVLVEKYHSNFMGQEFDGYGMTGYDNVDGEYWGTWCDTMSTAVAVMKGECSDDGTCTMYGTYKDPMTMTDIKTRFVSSVQEGGAREVMTSYMMMPDGSEMKTMELVYTRE